MVLEIPGKMKCDKRNVGLAQAIASGKSDSMNLQRDARVPIVNRVIAVVVRIVTLVKSESSLLILGSRSRAPRGFVSNLLVRGTISPRAVNEERFE